MLVAPLVVVPSPLVAAVVGIAQVHCACVPGLRVFSFSEFSALIFICSFSDFSPKTNSTVCGAALTRRGW